MNNMMGVMFDCSRNGVMNIPTLKKYAKILKDMGYNSILLYMEDVYEVDNQPAFGYMRGKYLKKELKEIDDYCDSIGIEIIPCIQTLAHLNCMFKWGTEYGDIRDCDDILLVEEEKTYKLIEDMISSLSSCLRTKRIHVGMDEATMLGFGNYREKHGICDRLELINNHLHKVCEITEKYGYENIMIWSDMFCNIALDTPCYYFGEYDYKNVEGKIKLPENVEMVFWDYYCKYDDHYDMMFDINKAFGNKVCFAGGAWTWNGPMPNNAYSLKVTEPAMKACHRHGIEDMFMCSWSDDGTECSKLAVLPSLMYAIETFNGNFDMDSIKKKFKDIVGVDYDAFMMLSEFDKPGNKHEYHPNRYWPCKHLLYNDVLGGLNDYRCTPADEEFYKNLSERISKLDNVGEYGYVFETAKALADLLAVKSNIGNRLREAYKAMDKKALKKLLKEYDLLIKKIEKFDEVQEKQWFTEYKPYGYDILQLRHGGMIQRIKGTKKRVKQLINGEITNIPELDEEVLELETVSIWSRIVSPHFINHHGAV